MNLLEACDDPNLFRQWFRTEQSWLAWRAFYAALFALPMTPEQVAVFREHTGRQTPPTAQFGEAWMVVGRRGGKSFSMALIAVYLACFREYRQYLQPGERATVMVIAADRKQARTILRYVAGLLRNIPLLAATVDGENAESFNLSNGVTIEVGTASFRATRGYTLAAVICDEIAFWRDEASANPDEEILAALRPGMATIPGAMLLAASSPYARRGAMWKAYERHYAKDGSPVLVWKAPTRAMNPSVPQSLVAEAMEQDRARAMAEYGAEFRTDIETLFTREAVKAVVDAGVLERPYISGTKYFGFVDPSGGSADSMTLGIAHREGTSAILDLVREVKPPFSPDAVAKEFADTLLSYGLHTVTGDRYGGEWPRERFRVHNITYHLATATRSDLYLAMLPQVNSGRVALLDHAKLQAQLIGLERRTSRGGRDLVDHAPSSHDDIANAVAGALHLAGSRELSRTSLVGAELFLPGGSLVEPETIIGGVW